MKITGNDYGVLQNLKDSMLLRLLITDWVRRLCILKVLYSYGQSLNKNIPRASVVKTGSEGCYLCIFIKYQSIHIKFI